MSVRKREVCPASFEENLNAGNLEGVVNLYDAGAVFVSESVRRLLAAIKFDKCWQA